MTTDERRKILLLNTDTDRAENLDDNLANYLHGVLFDQPRVQREAAVITYNVHQGIFPDEREQFDGAMITGSVVNVRSGAPGFEEWVTQLGNYLPTLRNQNCPILGVCFGSQITAISFGGEVQPIGTTSDGKPVYELGYPEVRLTPEGIASPLFEGFNPVFRVNESHRNIVVNLPPGSTLLAENDFGYQAFQLDKNIFGIQFHPEIYLNPAIRSLERRIKKSDPGEYRDNLTSARDRIGAEYTLTNGNEAVKIYSNFVNNFVLR